MGTVGGSKSPFLRNFPFRYFGVLIATDGIFVWNNRVIETSICVRNHQPRLDIGSLEDLSPLLQNVVSGCVTYRQPVANTLPA